MYIYIYVHIYTHNIIVKRWNCYTGFLDYINHPLNPPEVSGYFQRFPVEQSNIPVGIRGKPFAPVRSRRFP